MSIEERINTSSELFPRFLQRRSIEAIKRTRLTCGDYDRWYLTPRVISTVQPQGLTRRELCEKATTAALATLSSPNRPLSRYDYGTLTSIRDFSDQDEIDRYPITGTNGDDDEATLDFPLALTGVLSNSVYRSPINGSWACTPWNYARSGMLPAISLIGLQQTLMNVMCFQFNPKAGEQMRLVFRPPFRGDFSLSPRNTTLQQSAVTSAKIGEFLVYFTCHLIRLAMGIELFYPIDRKCYNRVITTHLRIPINLARLQRLNPTMVELRPVFDGFVIKDPEFPNIKLLGYPTGSVICVGGQDEEIFRPAMLKHVPIFYQARRLPSDEAVVKKKKGRLTSASAASIKMEGNTTSIVTTTTTTTTKRQRARKRKAVEIEEDPRDDVEDIQLSRPLKRGRMILAAAVDDHSY